ncbi:MAG: hypothetical protein LBQ66_02640 [Planctomycetaceae bacterium]|nr:hypothetical protein [Planctomycetaceae bacterium]
MLVLPMCVGDPVVGCRRRNRPAVGYPPYVLQHILAFSSNSFDCLAHRGGRDARVPVLRRYAAIVGFWFYQHVSCSISSAASLRR